MELILQEPRISVNSESDLIYRSQAGDKHAFELLYRQSVDHVYALCLRIVADVPLAEEFTQVAFVRAWEMLKSFRGESAFSTWLHRIAVNVILSNERSEQRRRARVEYADLEDIDDPNNSSSDVNVMDLERGIAGLPPKARMVLVLHDIEGYQHDEIAAQMNVSVGTSKSQLHRAHKLLKEWLGP